MDSLPNTANSCPLLSVIIPVYNERDTVVQVITEVTAVSMDVQVIVVDDASTDGTIELLKGEVAALFPNVQVVFHSSNTGKGRCIRTAIPLIRGTYSIIQDADLEYSPSDFSAIVDCFEATRADAVYGSRFLAGVPPIRFANLLINRMLAWMVRFMFRVPMTDEATCYKAFHSDILKLIPLTCERFEFCPEVTAKLIRRGYRIAEVPVSYSPRTIEQGKKIRWTDGVEAIWTLIKWRFVRF